MAIIPDTKNWTWVLDTPCEECGFDASTFVATDVAARLRANAAQWPQVLARPDVRDRPDESTWSPLEYAAHVRDVGRLYLVRLNLMLDEDDPVYPNWNQDATALAERYDLQDPAVVSTELVTAAAALADAFDAVSGEQWSRVGRRGDGARFTIDSFAKYFIHDWEHHLYDVTK